MSFINFSKLDEFDFFKIEISCKKLSFSTYISNKNVILDTYFEIAPVSQQSR